MPLSRRSVLLGLCTATALVAASALPAQPMAAPGGNAVVRRLRVWQCVNEDCEPYIYDPSIGAEYTEDENNPIPPGVSFAELPEDWVCPVCADPKSHFLPTSTWVEVAVPV